MNPFFIPRALALLASASVLSACIMVGPDYEPPPTATPGSWQRLESTAQPTIETAGTGDISQWWQKLSDPLLSELVDQALRSSPDLRSAQARLREARARRAIAAADRFPTVTASGSGRRSRSSKETGGGDTREFYSAGFDAGWELDVFGGVRRSVEAAEADLEATAANLQETLVSLAAETALNYIEVRTLQSRLAIAQANLAIQSETLQLTEWRAQAGLVSSQDVEQARSSREQTRAQIPALETNLAEAEHRLEILLGKNPGTLHERLAPTGLLPSLPERIAVGIPADTLRQRPDVQAAERRLAAETARIGVAEAARYPSFKISGSVGVEALTLSALDNGGAGTAALLGNITSPIFDAGRLRNQARAQEAVRDQVLVAYEQTVLNALQEVENALVSLLRNGERSEALAIATASAENAAELARQRYSAGLIDFQPVLDTQRSVRTLEDTLATSRAEGVLALIRLYKSLGGGWSPLSDDKEKP
ncbi:MAG: efflux transporter outer membrane subunit [Desulfuromonadaceae bacterium]|nr:efflux transporter outer membrane subunit [Desulfuromonadaceae bacterium]